MSKLVSWLWVLLLVFVASPFSDRFIVALPYRVARLYARFRGTRFCRKVEELWKLGTIRKPPAPDKPDQE